MINKTEYVEAVQHLVDNAIKHSASSTGKRSAQIICALYDGNRFPVDLVGIAANFDKKNMAAFVTLLTGFRTFYLTGIDKDGLMDQLRKVAA